METYADVVARLSLDNSKFVKGVKDSKKEVEGLGDEAEKAGERTEDGLKKGEKAAGGFSKVVGKLGPMIGAAFAADALIGFGKRVISTTAEFQKMQAVLTNTLGSNSSAKIAMDQISDFASQTPFAVNELTEAFVKLANRGFVPTTDELRSLGDLASSTGKSFDQLTEAALDAMTGEFERLKEFGIRASAEGDRVQFTFKGVTTEVQKTDEAIKDYILSLGNAEGVSGAMAGISETVGGKISNLDDNFTQLYKAIGDSSSGLISGILDLSNALVGNLAKSFDAVNTVTEKQKEGGFMSFIKQIATILDPTYAKIVRETAEAYKAADKAINDAMMAGRAHFESEGKARAQLKELTEEQKKRAEETKKFYTSAINLSTQYNDALLAEYSTVKLMAEATKKLADAYQGAYKDLYPSAPKMQDINLGLNDKDFLERTHESLIQNQIEVDKFNQKVALTQSLAGMLGSTFQSAFEGMLNSGKVSFRGIIDGLKALVIKLIAAAAAAFALAAILSSISGGAGIAMKMGAKSGGFGDIAKMFLGKFTGIPFAEGGMVTGLTSAILGDNPSGKEAVIPFEKMGSFLSQYGTGGNQNMRVEVVGRLQGEDIYFSGLNYSNGRNKIIGG
jgi:hypothetical protein